MKKHTTYRLAALLAMFVLVLAVAPQAFAADQVVTATTEMVDYCVNLDGGEVLDFGTTPLGGFSYDLADGEIRIRNTGALDTQVMIQGTDATGPDGTWALADEPGSDQFAWSLALSDEGGYGEEQYVSTTPRVLISNLAHGSALRFRPMLFAPTHSSGHGTYTFSATIYATALPE